MARGASGLSRQLIFALVVPAGLVLAAMAFFVDVAVRGALEEALGERLCAVAGATATTVDPRVVLLERGDDDSRISRRTQKKLEEMSEATDVQRVLIVALDGQAQPRNATVLADSRRKLTIGDEYVRARFDATELDTVRRGERVASVLFRSADGRWYKTGYAPIRDGGKTRAAVVVEAPAQFFDLIDDLRGTLGAIVIVGFAALIGLAVIASRQVTVPLSRLSNSAEQIGRGELSTEIPGGGPREAAILAETMRSMAASLSVRDEETQVMLAGIAHEVRNPLGGIELFGSLLREQLEEGDVRRGHVDKILKEINVLADVVNDFLAFARKQPLDLNTIEVSDVVEQVVAMAQGDADQKGVELSGTADGESRATFDRLAIERALLNLVRNGIQATPEGGRVELQAHSRDTLVFEVVDSGPGIPQDKREEIFAPFFTTKQKGTGLGLALVKKSVDAHGGTIRVDDAAGGGSRLIIELPLKPANKASVEEEPGLLA